MIKALYISGARIYRMRFFGMKMSIGRAEPLINNLVQHYLEYLTTKLESRVLHNKSVFDIGMETPIDCIEFLFIYLFGDDKRRAKKFREEKVHLMCDQSNFGSLSFRPTKLGEIKQIKIYQKLIHVVLSVIARLSCND
jgi:hypothetical protein